MLLALGLFLVLPLTGAHRQETTTDILESSNSSSFLSSSLSSSAVPAASTHSESSKTFFSGAVTFASRILLDGGFERIVRTNELCAKETTVDWGDTQVIFREIWLRNFGRKLQLVYEDGTWINCVDKEYTRGEENVCLETGDFDDLKQIGSNDNVIRYDHRITKSPASLYDLNWISAPEELRRQCKLIRSKIRSQLIQRHSPKPKRSRNRRVRRELFLIPGTQWCGRGHRATKYTNLGGFGVADACCRKHDTACPYFIPAFETRYGVFNWGISTMMHCTCDERFRTCLKMAGTSSADLIGKIFFNMIQPKCFVLKPQKVCTKRTWWGKCQHHEYRKQAYVRDNVPY